MRNMPLLALATLSVAASALAGCAGSAACGNPPCTIARAKLGELDGHLIIPASLNGHMILAALDTGAYLSATTIATADAVDATTVATTDSYSTGIYNTEAPVLIGGIGGSTVARLRTVGELELAGGKLRDAALWAVPSLRFRDKRIAGLIGGDLLQNWDLDLDVGNDELALDAPQRGAVIVPPWKGATTEVGWSGDWRIKIPVTLDGHRLIAEVDTGAPRSLVDESTEAGAEEKSSDKPFSGSGIAGRRVTGRVHSYGDLSIGGHSYGPIDVGVAPMGLNDGDVDMLLGADFLNAYRVYIDYHAGKMLIDDDTP